MTSPLIARFEINRQGRDFVVGDIHGEFVALNAAMEKQGFDPEKDRLFSVGDLIDRGQHSIAALDWLAEPWFFAVLGNHEQMAIDGWNDEKSLRWWTKKNGGGWWLDVDTVTQKRFVDTFRDLPLVMEIDTTYGKVGIVHADVPPGVNWGEFTRGLEMGDTSLRQHALWARTRLTQADNKAKTPVHGITRVYCGHTPLRNPTQMGNVFFIDTGACYTGGKLTLLRL
ncbi:MAG: metallophosphoesterase [Gammaproteobacteria bacterium]